MSRHEGFCLPVVEAMHFGVPVIAYACSATETTVGEGGILVSERGKYAQIAELIGLLKDDSALRQAVMSAGHERANQLSFEGFQQAVSQVFD